MGRSPGYSKEGLNRGAWTNQEDKILSEYIRIHGDGGWGNLPQKAGLNRRGKSCRLRWLNYLRPEIKRGNISMDEEELIIRLHRLLGNRWSLIAGRLPGRTDNEIKNYWNTHLSKKLQSMNESQPKTSTQNFKNRSKCPSPALENQVFKTSPLQRTISVRHSGSVRPCGHSNCSSSQGSKLCDLKETANFSKSLSDHRFLKGSVTHDDPVSTASAAADVNLLEIAEAGNYICYMSSSHDFASDAATLAEGLLDLNYLSAPDCNPMLCSPSDCLTAIGLEELYREPAPIFAAEMNPLEEICFDEGNMQRVKSFTMADDQDLEEFYNINPDCADWIHEFSVFTKI